MNTLSLKTIGTAAATIVTTASLRQCNGDRPRAAARRSVVKKTWRVALPIALLGCLCAADARADDYPFTGNPPITPRWTYEHWVWEDNTNTQASTVQLVSDYQTRNIPVGAVIVDSPWSTAYMNFAFNSAKYPDPQTMITNFRNQGIQVVCWMVGMINQSGGEAPLLPHPSFDFVRSSGYQIRNPANSDPSTNDIFAYWKGAGLAIDFTNPNAVNWFMGNGNANLIAMGVRGFKVDESNAYVSDPVKTSAGSVYAGANITKAQYTAHYHAKVSDWIRSQTASTGSDGIVISRPYSWQGQPAGFHCPVSKMTAGWCGDFAGDFAGFATQIDNIYTSADAGYSAVGFEVGGYYNNSATRDSLLRQAQFAALLPVMENGGSNGGLTNHLPWYWDTQNGTTTTVPIYRYYATLHHNLAPFLFHLGVVANLTGTPAVTNTDLPNYRHLLGDAFLTRAIMAGDNTSVTMTFPAGLWIDWWNPANVYAGSGQATVVSAIDKAPIYVRAGAIVPVNVDSNITGLGDTNSAGKDTIMVYPYGTTSLTYHRAIGDGIPYEDVALTVAEGSNGSLQVNSPTSRTWLFKVKCFAAPSSVTGADTWSYDDTSKTLTIQKAGAAFTVSVTDLVGYSSITPISTNQTMSTFTMTADDASGSTSFNTAGNWSSGSAPASGNDYTTSFKIRSSTTAGTYTFAGNSLTINTNGTLQGKMGGTGTLAFTNGTGLLLNGGLVMEANSFNSGNILTIAGTITAKADSTTFLGATAGESLDISGAIGGSGNLTIGGSANGGNNISFVTFDAANTLGGTVSVVTPNSIGDATNRLLQLNHVNGLQNATLALTGGGQANLVSFSSASNTGTYNIGALSDAANQALTDTTGAAVAISVGANNVSTTYSGGLSGAGSLTKVGNGTLTLSGANTYTGATTVNAGTLSVNGSIVTTAATVASGATLSGTGTAGNVIVQSGGALAPGNAGVGAFTTANTTIGGTLAVEIASAVSADRLTVSGSLTLTGPLTVTAPAGLAASATFTLIDKTSAGPVSGTFAGQPQNSLFTASGYTWIINYAGGEGNDVTLTVATPLQSWQWANFGADWNNPAIAGATADPDSDGVNNLLERAFGMNPGTADRNLLPAVDGAAPLLSITYRKANAATDLAFAVLESPDLSPASWVAASGTSSILGNDGTVQTIRFTSPAAGAAKKFLRVQVTPP